MIAMPLERIAQLTQGQRLGANPTVSRVCIDSRALEAGDLFVALRGQRFDGNQFLAQVADAGAAAAIANVKSEALPMVLVEDSYRALGQVAREHRRSFNGPLVAITGSSGKTTSKEMLAAILSQCGAVLATSGNFNNEVGVPLTLLALTDEHEFAVIEMGAAKRGDIAYLCDFAEPDIALLTNAQAAHIQGFKTLRGVAETKGEIFERLGNRGVAVINGDDPHASLWQELAGSARQLRFGLECPDADVWARKVDVTQPGHSQFILCCEQGEVEVTLPLPGRHMVVNALGAAAAALAAGADLQQIAAGLAAMTSTSGRLASRRFGDVTVIDDSYNANPGSVRAAIDVLKAYPGRRILVLGAMAELGEEAEQRHREVAAYASAQGIDVLFAVGSWAQVMLSEFAGKGWAFPDREELTSVLLRYLEHSDTVLIKGSRSAAMDHVVQALAQELSGGSR